MNHIKAKLVLEVRRSRSPMVSASRCVPNYPQVLAAASFALGVAQACLPLGGSADDSYSYHGFGGEGGTVGGQGPSAGAENGGEEVLGGAAGAAVARTDSGPVESDGSGRVFRQ
jgi:hypothetical protein